MLRLTWEEGLLILLVGLGLVGCREPGPTTESTPAAQTDTARVHATQDKRRELLVRYDAIRWKLSVLEESRPAGGEARVQQMADLNRRLDEVQVLFSANAELDVIEATLDDIRDRVVQLEQGS